MCRSFFSALIAFAGMLAMASMAAAESPDSVVADTLHERNSNVRMSINVGDKEVVKVEVDDPDNVRDADHVRFGEDIEVSPGTHMEGDVVTMGGDIIVYGRVGGDCVSIGGDVTLEDGAEVEGDVVCMGGTLTLGDSVLIGSDAVSLWGALDVSPTAKIGGHVTDVGVGQAVPKFDLWDRHRGTGSRLLGFMGRVVWVLLLVGMGLVAFSVFPTRMRRVAATVEHRTIVTFLAGMAGWILWLPAVLLLCITLVGIPVAILLVVFTPIMALLGYLAVAEVVGKRLVQRLGITPAGAFKTMLVGVGALEGAVLLGKFLGMIGSFLHYFGMLLAVLGWSVIFVAVTMGFGAFLMTRFRAAVEPPVEAPTLVPPAPPVNPQSYSMGSGS
ncbi:MAG TPA: hypothetical protein VFP10_13885 [Candidatus Eisenbacteria bacterium]|nr:hypothetical protein [Candidatus Eisenbacteria bacterium]